MRFLDIFLYAQAAHAFRSFWDLLDPSSPFVQAAGSQGVASCRNNCQLY